MAYIDITKRYRVLTNLSLSIPGTVLFLNVCRPDEAGCIQSSNSSDRPAIRCDENTLCTSTSVPSHGRIGEIKAKYEDALVEWRILL